MAKSLNETKINWYDSQVDLLNFAKYLHDKDEFDDVDAVIYFFEKPWKWNEEWKQYQIRQARIDAELQILHNLTYADIEPTAMMDSNGSDY